MTLPIDPAGQPGASAAAAPAQGQTPAPAGAAAPPSGTGQPAAPVQPTIVQMPTSALAAVKREAKKKGAAEAQGQYDGRAQALGYANADAMFASLAASRTASGAPAQPPGQTGAPAAQAPAANPPAGQPAAPQGQHEYTSQLEARLAALEAERAADRAVEWLRSSGVQDTGLTMLAMQQAAAEAGDKFDPAAWLTAQRTERPYLFAAPPAPSPVNPTGTLAPSAVPAGTPNNTLLTSGPQGAAPAPAAAPAAPPAPPANSGVPGNAAAAPGVPAVATPASAPKLFDATTATPAQIAARLREQGFGDVASKGSWLHLPAAPK